MNGFEKKFRDYLELAPYTKAEKEKIVLAFFFAKEKHGKQMRRNGELYFSHVVEVSIKMMRHQFPAAFATAGLLHDCVEDAGVSLEEIKERFGELVVFLVDFMSRNILYNFNNYREKMIFFLGIYPPAIFLRLSDVSHNFDTPEYFKKAWEKIEEAEFFLAIGEQTALSERAEEILRQVNPMITIAGLFGFLQRLADKVKRAKLIHIA